jgi:6-phosphogluconolactonase (cycloisomerase 2 family)
MKAGKEMPVFVRKIILPLFLLVSLSAFAQKTFLITNNDSFLRPNSVSTYAIQSDGSLLLVGQFPTGGNGGGNSGDPSGGGIGFISTTRIVVTPDNRFVFATNAPDNTVSGFSVDASTGLLTLVPGSPFPTGGNACQGMGLASSPDSHSLFAMNTCSQDITAFQVGANGALTAIGARASTSGEGEDLKVTGDGKFVAVTVHGFPNGTDMFSIAADGSLASVPGSPFIGSFGSPVSVEANCKGDQIFVLKHGAPSSVDTFNVGADGSLALQSSFTIPLPANAGGEVSMYLSPDGKLLFVGDVFSFASSFHVASDGSLTPESLFVPATGTFFMGHVVTDPAGKFLYGSGLFNNLAAYSIDNNGALALLPASPFSTPGFNAIGSFAAYPSKSCSPSLSVGIKLRPQDQGRGNPMVTVGASSLEPLDVAILSSALFDAPAQVDTSSLTFGHTGSEPSLISCRGNSLDVNGDGVSDLICSFRVRLGGFVPGDTQAVLHGKTRSGTPIVGTAPISVVP